MRKTALLAFLSYCLFHAPFLYSQDKDFPAQDQDWSRMSGEGFTLISQLDENSTQAFAAQFTAWQQAVNALLNEPALAQPTYLYLFETPAALSRFTPDSATAVFYHSPRANYLALLNDQAAIQLGLHQFGHFLVRNSLGAAVPRWYEEGMAEYLSRLQFSEQGITLRQYTAEEIQAALYVNRGLSLESLFFEDAALASPLMVQMANTKSALLLHFLRHGHQQRGVQDYRQGLNDYLTMLQAGRNHRFAFDQGFSVSLNRLSSDYLKYLRIDDRQAESLAMTLTAEPVEAQAESLSAAERDGLFAELALNGGFFQVAEYYFSAAGQLDDQVGRYQSGLADARRMQDIEADYEPVYKQAIAVSPGDIQLYLDYGQYLEEQLGDCSSTMNETSRRQLMATVQENYEKALALDENNPETHLSLGQLYLLPAADSSEGVPYQQRVWELLPADTFVAEQAVNYALLQNRYDEAEEIINWLSRPYHYWGEQSWITDLATRLAAARQGLPAGICSL